MKKYLKLAAFIIMIFVFSSSVYASEEKTFDTKNVHVFQKTANDNENFVILFLGDGYTKDEQEKFLEDTSIRVNTLLSKEPFKSHSDKINIYALPTVSAESGATYSGDIKKDTYFSITFLGRKTFFGLGGEEKAREIKKVLEENYLDKNAVIGTIHIISNSEHYFGSSTSALFSYGSMTPMYSGGEVSVHEIVHSIGKLKDEYGAVLNGANASQSNSVNDIEWTKFLGFGGVGITPNENHSSSFIPTLSCIMKHLDNPEFCEVCKCELVRRLNSSMYMQNPKSYYAANPDITTEHNPTSTIGKAYENCKISDRNIAHANGHNLEFRTIMQNLTNEEKHFKLSLKITNQSGNTKFFKEENFTLPPLENEYNPDAARMSMSVNIENISGLTYGDKISGVILDTDNNTIVATDKTAKAKKIKLNIHHKIKDEHGNITDMPNTSPSRLYIENDTVYTPSAPKYLNEYEYIGNSFNNIPTKINESVSDIDFYYQSVKKTTTQLSADGKTFTINPHNIPENSVISLALYNSGNLIEIKNFIYSGSKITHTTEKKYSSAKVMALTDLKTLTPICKAEQINPQ